jgi:hypothetical protein
MPTTIPLVSSDVNIELVRGGSARTPNLDFIVIAVFALIGVLLTLGFASLFPLSADMAALMSSVS